jgi:hypothetical protein
MSPVTRRPFREVQLPGFYLDTKVRTWALSFDFDEVLLRGIFRLNRPCEAWTGENAPRVGELNFNRVTNTKGIRGTHVYANRTRLANDERIMTYFGLYTHSNSPL